MKNKICKNDFIIIQLKDICYYDNDFNYDPIIVKKEQDFEEKYNKFVKICKNYETFQEIEDFIYENFIQIEIEEREIYI